MLEVYKSAEVGLFSLWAVEKAFKVFRLNMIRTVLEASILQMLGREIMWNEFHLESKAFKEQIRFKENLNGNYGYGDR